MEKQKLPNATAVLILGILSILTCCCYGVIGIITGSVALYLAKKDIAKYLENPDLYDNYSNIKIGRILAIIGIILSVLCLLFMIWIISIVGLENMGDQQLVNQKVFEALGIPVPQQ